MVTQSFILIFIYVCLLAIMNNAEATSQRCSRHSFNQSNYGCSDPDATAIAPDTYGLVLRLAEDNMLFLRLFGQSFANMSMVGYYYYDNNTQSSSIGGKLGQLVSIDLSSC